MSGTTVSPWLFILSQSSSASGLLGPRELFSLKPSSLIPGEVCCAPTRPTDPSLAPEGKDEVQECPQWDATGSLRSRCEWHHLVPTTSSGSLFYVKPSILSRREVFPPIDSCWQILMGRNRRIPRWRLIKTQMAQIFLFFFFKLCFFGKLGHFGSS